MLLVDLGESGLEICNVILERRKHPKESAELRQHRFKRILMLLCRDQSKRVCVLAERQPALYGMDQTWIGIRIGQLIRMHAHGAEWLRQGGDAAEKREIQNDRHIDESEIAFGCFGVEKIGAHARRE